jgi:hypothetical protein
MWPREASDRVIDEAAGAVGVVVVASLFVWAGVHLMAVTPHVQEQPEQVESGTAIPLLPVSPPWRQNASVKLGAIAGAPGSLWVGLGDTRAIETDCATAARIPSDPSTWVQDSTTRWVPQSSFLFTAASACSIGSLLYFARSEGGPVLHIQYFPGVQLNSADELQLNDVALTPEHWNEIRFALASDVGLPDPGYLRITSQ